MVEDMQLDLTTDPAPELVAAGPSFTRHLTTTEVRMNGLESCVRARVVEGQLWSIFQLSSWPTTHHGWAALLMAWVELARPGTAHAEAGCELAIIMAAYREVLSGKGRQRALRAVLVAHPGSTVLAAVEAVGGKTVANWPAYFAATCRGMAVERTAR